MALVFPRISLYSLSAAVLQVGPLTGNLVANSAVCKSMGQKALVEGGIDG